MTLDNIEQELSTLLSNEPINMAVHASRIVELFDLLQKERIRMGLGPSTPSPAVQRCYVYMVVRRW